MLGFSSLGMAVAWLALGLPVHGQHHRCAATLEYDPVLVPNTGSRVTYVCAAATRLEVIQAVGRQTRLAIGVILGRDTRSLLRQRRAYDLESMDGRQALSAAIRGTGYTLRERDGVIVLRAGDLSRRQRSLLHNRYVEFRANPGDTLTGMGQSLTMSLQVAAGARGGFALGGLGSTNDEGFTLPPLPRASTEELADRIVQLGPHGLWIFRASPGRPRGEPTDTVPIESYQHYANRPQIDRRRNHP